MVHTRDLHGQRSSRCRTICSTPRTRHHLQLNAEIIKTVPQPAALLRLPLFVAIWKGKTIPEDWCKGTIVTIPKKHDLTHCLNVSSQQDLEVLQDYNKTNSVAVDKVQSRNKLDFEKEEIVHTIFSLSETPSSSAQIGRENSV